MGGTVQIETRGENFYDAGPDQPIHALSRVEVEEIAARFEPLNPFDRSLLPGSPLQLKVEGNGLFCSTKRYAISAPDGSFIDCKETILGILVPPCSGFIQEAWRTIGEIWDGVPPSPRPWLKLPAVRRLALVSPEYARQITGLPNDRPWNSYMAATAIGQKPGEELRTALAIAPLEADPDKWAGLIWCFADTGEPVPLGAVGAAGFRWRLRTIQDFLTNYARHSIPEMLAHDGTPCGPFTRGVLRRRPVRDGERWLTLKEAAVFGDDPQNAFSVPTPEMVRRPSSDRRAGSLGAWEATIKPALIQVGPAAVAQRMGLSARAARSWAAGEREPAELGKLARTIAAVAREGGLSFSEDEHLRAEEICAELPARAFRLQSAIATTLARLVEHHGGVRALARAMRSDAEGDLEPTLRRWAALGSSEPRPIADLNRVVAGLATLGREGIQRQRRRVIVERGPVGDRQIVWVLLQLLQGADELNIPRPEETLTNPLA